MGVGSSKVETAGGHGELFLFFLFFLLFLLFLLLFLFVLLAVGASVVFVSVVENSNTTAEKCKEQQTSKKGKAIKIKHTAQRSKESTQAKKSKKHIKTKQNKKYQEPQTTLIAKINNPNIPQ
jgi:ABC-type protease/lipase transport system fused ATPase/permease subunit